MLAFAPPPAPPVSANPVFVDATVCVPADASVAVDAPPPPPPMLMRPFATPDCVGASMRAAATGPAPPRTLRTPSTVLIDCVLVAVMLDVLPPLVPACTV